MREWRILCDCCGVEISGNPFTACFERVSREDETLPIEGETFSLDLCESCVDVIRSWKMVRANTVIRADIIPGKEPETPADLTAQITDELFGTSSDDPELEKLKEKDNEPKDSGEPAPPKARKTKSKVDLGKIIALKKADWSYKQIADEMKLTEKQVGNYLYNAKKRGQI